MPDPEASAPALARALQGVWLVAPVAVGWAAVSAASASGGGALPLLGQGILVVLWGAGIVAALRLDAASVAFIRICAAAGTVWGVIAVASSLGLPAGVLAGWGLVMLTLSFAPQITDETARRASIPRERRIPLAIPALLLAAVVLPATLLVGFAAGLLPALLVGMRLGAFELAAAIVIAVAAIPVALSLWRLPKRWLVIVPSGLVLHDPVLLAESYRLAPDEIAWVELAPDNWREVVRRDGEASLADLTGGSFSNPVVIVLKKALPGPMRRPRRDGASVNMVACRPSNRAQALSLLRGAGYERPESEGVGSPAASSARE